jgi:hypothetical protein
MLSRAYRVVEYLSIDEDYAIPFAPKRVPGGLHHFSARILAAPLLLSSTRPGAITAGVLLVPIFAGPDRPLKGLSTH